jgi:flagellar basal-body rod protein FlgB
MIDGLTNAGAIPALERLMEFAARRHEVLADNIANLSTPDYRARDVSVRDFQDQLGAAIDRRRAENGGTSGELRLADSQQVRFSHDAGGRLGRMVLEPDLAGEGGLFHDGGERDLERAMQGLVENFMAFRTAAQFMRKQFETLQVAIRERM